MAQRCSICTHPKAELIESLLATAAPLRGMADEFGVTTSSLSRHRTKHMSAALIAIGVEHVSNDLPLTDRLELLIARVERMLAKAEESGKATQAIAAVKEMRNLLELLGKASGELDERPQVTVNLMSSPEWLAVRAAIFGALAAFPEARAAVSSRLVGIEP